MESWSQLLLQSSTSAGPMQHLKRGATGRFRHLLLLVLVPQLLSVVLHGHALKFPAEASMDPLHSTGARSDHTTGLEVDSTGVQPKVCSHTPDIASSEELCADLFLKKTALGVV